MGLFGKQKKGKHSDSLEYIPEQGSGLDDPSFVHSAPHALTAEEVLGNLRNTPHKKTQSIPMQPGVSPLDALKKRVKSNVKSAVERDAETNNTAVPTFAATQKKEQDDRTLLDKCMPFIADGGGVPKDDKPNYELESIDSIINKSEIRAAKLLEQLSNIGTVTYDSLGKEADKTHYENNAATKKAVSDATQEIPMQSKGFVNAPIKTISDIDNTDTASDKTIQFDSLSTGANYEDISSGTKIIDLSTQMFEEENTVKPTLLVNPFDFEDPDFTVADDYTCFEDAKRIGGKLISKLKAARLRGVITFLLFLLMTSALLPSIHDMLYVNQAFFGIISVSVFAVICLVNYDCFAAIPSLFKKQYVPESVTGVLGVMSIIYSLHTLYDNKNPYFVLLFISMMFVFKCIAVIMRASSVLGNFRIIASRSKKYGLEFIDDRKTTHAMAKNAVDGDVLVGISSPCTNILDFMKNTEIDRAANGNFSIFALVSFIVSVVLGVFYGIFTESFNGCLMASTVFLGFAFSPTMLFADIFPLHSAAKRLNRLGAMITGSTAAKKIELANAVTLRSCDLFPDGTISLVNMHILDSNKVDDTLILAAALTKQIDSPFRSIFADIVKTGNKSIPVADSVKYEERLGISGWVGNKHVFIGNRTLLEAHGIKTPSFEIDKKILRNGCFPIYVASDEKPCALLVVKYNVKASIAHELQKLCASGVTLLVDTCDQNIISEMVCDYFGLYEESVYVMGGSGAQVHQETSAPKYDISAYAAHKGNCEGFLSIFNCAAKIKRDTSALRIFHIISWIVMTAVFIYSSYLNDVSPISSGMAFVYIGLSLVISLIIHIFNKP